MIPGQLEDKLQIDILQIGMAAQNLSGDRQQKTVGDLTCSLYFTPELHGHLTVLLVLNSILSVTAFLGNVLTVIALHKESSLHPPSKLLLGSLATTDLCVGLISQPFAIVYLLSVLIEHWNIRLYAFTVQIITSYIFCGVSISTLTAISVDRLLALLLGLRYKQVVTLKGTCVIVIAIWVVCTVSSAIEYFWNRLTILWCCIMSVCLVISISSYAKIFFTLRHHEKQVQGHPQQPNQTNQLNKARYKKAVSTAIWLELTLVTCYLPFIIVIVLKNYSGLSSSLCCAWSYAGTLVYLNSSLNPILYFWKIEEVRQAVKDTIRQALCFCFSS